MNVAIIPARGGSKRIPRKNIREFAGKPMIAHAILTAKASNLFDKVIVSTDDVEIAEVSRTWGAEIPFIRPDELADDHTPTVPVVAHAIENCQVPVSIIQAVCCVYPCVPMLRIEDLQAAMTILVETKLDYVFPVVAFPSAIQRALRLSPDGTVSPFYNNYVHARTQDLEPAFYDAGQFYWGNPGTWLSGKPVHSHGCGIEIPAWRSVDIDTPDDWCRAELIYKAIALGGAGADQHMRQVIRETGVSADAGTSIFRFSEQIPTEAKIVRQATDIPAYEHYPMRIGER